jgi:hypothetical protein
MITSGRVVITEESPGVKLFYWAWTSPGADGGVAKGLSGPETAVFSG